MTDDPSPRVGVRSPNDRGNHRTHPNTHDPLWVGRKKDLPRRSFYVVVFNVNGLLCGSLFRFFFQFLFRSLFRGLFLGDFG